MARVSFLAASKLADLLRQADPKNEMQVKVQSTNMLALGVDVFNPTIAIDLAREVIQPFSQSQHKDPTPVRTQPTHETPKVIRYDEGVRQSRRTGKYVFVFRGEPTNCGSLKDALAAGLRAIESYRPGTLDKLTIEMPRTKRIVARDRSKLFQNAELVENFSERLMEGWWFGTNNSKAEVCRWLDRACAHAGLRWEKDASLKM